MATEDETFLGPTRQEVLVYFDDSKMLGPNLSIRLLFVFENLSPRLFDALIWKISIVLNTPINDSKILRYQVNDIFTKTIAATNSS